MPIYIYRAKPHPHKTIQADIEAESEQDAINKLVKIGYYPISLEPKDFSFSGQGLLSFKKVSLRELVLFTNQLSSLIASGVNIINALNIISRQSYNKHLRLILGDIINRIKDGKSFSDSLELYPHLFPDLYSSMIRSGEASGNLNEALKRLANFLEEQHDFKDALRASLVYPFFIVAVGVLTVFVLLVFVIPRLVTMFEDMGQILPLPTRILINSSAALRSFGWLIIAVIFMFIFFMHRLYLTAQGKNFWDKLKLKLFIFGRIVVKTEIARLMHTLALLISSGIPVMVALDISTSIVENQILRSEVKKFKDEISNGATLSACLKGSNFFPEFVTSIVAIGEETGSLDKCLRSIADDYEKEVKRFLKTVTTLLEPVIILIMGLIVGFIVLSMLLPIFQINLIVR